MNKTEFIAAAAERSGITKKDAERLLSAAADIITESLVRGEKVQLTGFGIFETRHRNPRTGRNPHTREAVSIPAARVPAFKPSQTLRNIVEKEK